MANQHAFRIPSTKKCYHRGQFHQAWISLQQQQQHIQNNNRFGSPTQYSRERIWGQKETTNIEIWVLFEFKIYFPKIEMETMEKVETKKYRNVARQFCVEFYFSLQFCQKKFEFEFSLQTFIIFVLSTASHRWRCGSSEKQLELFLKRRRLIDRSAFVFFHFTKVQR